MAHVEWTDTGEESLVEIGRFIARQNQSLDRALAVINKVEEKCRLIAGFPDAGTVRDDLSDGVRTILVDNLVLVYRPLDDGIRVLLVTHGHRDLPALFETLFPNT